MISPKIEAARIHYVKRNMELRGFKNYQSEELIREAVEKHGDKLAVSCSFGSCSVVVLHMALQFKPDIKVVFNNTGVEYPETYAYRDLLKKEWNLNLIETKPLKSFWQCVKEYGFPLLRTSYSYKKKHGIKTRFHKPECCIYLKELPMAKACKDYDIEACLTGLRATESGVRMFTIAQRGMFYHTSRWGSLWRYHPLALWTHQQVWNYLKQNNIPINQIYLKGQERSGCMPCTGFKYWEKQLAKANPKMYRYIQKLRKVPLLDDYIELENETANTCVQPILEE
jgi:phosphoadenosine phosphosulfate reductase